MRILCVSDTHLQNEIFERITNHYNDIDLYLHCGDSSLPTDSPYLEKYLVVKGNHDFADFSLEKYFPVASLAGMMVHGHHHSVYHGYDVLLHSMEEHHVDICFHGHTHVPTYYHKGGKIIINPGSVMMNRANYGFGTFAIITVDESVFTVRFYHHETYEDCTEMVLVEGEHTLASFREILQGR